ncbi:hypothetical protein RHS01_03838 [Rhizoctonia solani]|uniref:Uncharacterized protein n=1 Tax=Rhizoctonia solani TaxID=456999 RepID=A0A8H7M5X4_9AGAM|nr:hypothetical protein RHS01_03838 [Rhizoctonia solani]
MSSSSTSSRSSQPPSGRKRQVYELMIALPVPAHTRPQKIHRTGAPDYTRRKQLAHMPHHSAPTVSDITPSPPASPAPPSQRRRLSPDTDQTTTPPASTPSPAPIRRPALTSAELSRMIPIYKERAKLFKRSGDSRKRTELRSRRLGLLELTDSVLHFAYVFWAEDREKSKGKSIMMCDVGTWRTLEGLVVACKGGWAKDGDPAARGLIGMLNLLEGLVLSRIAHSNIFSIRETTKGLIIPPSNSASTTTLNPNPNTGATPNPNAAGTPKNHPTPPSHVPSPAPTTSRSPVPPPAQQAHHRSPHSSSKTFSSTALAFCSPHQTLPMRTRCLTRVYAHTLPAHASNMLYNVLGRPF